MAQFQSAAKRSYSFHMLYHAVLDYVVVFVGALFFNDTPGQAAVVAIAIVIGIWLFQLVYAFFGVLKGSLLFFPLEKKQRVEAMVDQMFAVRMPKPMRFYSDAEEYFNEVVHKPEANSEAKLLAGVAIGSLATMRTMGAGFQAICLAMVLEEAIKRYGRKVGFVWDDGTPIAKKDLDDDDEPDDNPDSIDEQMAAALSLELDRRD